MTETEGALPATVRQLRGGLVAAFVVAAACNLVALIVPLYNMETFNRVAASRNLNTLAWLSAGLVAGVVVCGLLEYLRGSLHVALGAALAGRLRLPLLLAAARGKEAPGQTAGQAVRDLGEVQAFLGGQGLSVPFDLVWSPLLLLACFALHWAYGAVALACVAVLLAIGAANELLTKRPLAEANDETARAFGEVAVTVRGAEAVAAMGMLPALARRWQRSQGRMLAKLNSATRTSKALAAATRSLRLLMTAGMVTIGVLFAIKGEASGGSMLAGSMILAKLLLPFEQISVGWRQFVSARAAWGRLRGALTELRPLRDAIALPAPLGPLVVDRVVYIPEGHDRPVLRGVSFRLAPGEAIGIIGPSGAGKSSLGRLIVGIAEPSSGGIYLDGHSTFRWERGDFGRYVGYVPQKLALFDGSVGENIARMRAADPGEVIAAARKAGLHETIMALPNGYATQIDDSGFVLSGGQRQRLALARALFGAPRLLVLDEPNSNLDEEGERWLAAAIAEAKEAGTAIVVIAHRPSVLAAVDKLLVLKDGLVERFGAREMVIKALAAPPVQLLRSAQPA
jgi:ATP-binding cassette subfamily C protein